MCPPVFFCLFCRWRSCTSVCIMNVACVLRTCCVRVFVVYVLLVVLSVPSFRLPAIFFGIWNYLCGDLFFLRTDRVVGCVLCVFRSFVSCLSLDVQEEIPDDKMPKDSEGREFLINLIDSPGHVDFSAEVSLLPPYAAPCRDVHFALRSRCIVPMAQLCLMAAAVFPFRSAASTIRVETGRVLSRRRCTLLRAALLGVRLSWA